MEAAEGIEDVSQLEALKNLACGFGQGYLFSRPAPAVALNQLLSGTGGAQRKIKTPPAPLIR